ncbi:MAG: tol-pal system-associated acyl-CoA thioesterase [Kiloniellaceae bacterium]
MNAAGTQTPSGTTLSGQMVEGEHRLPLRIYYEDTDAGGIVYYARYLQFAERARTEILRLAGIEQTKLRDSHDVIFAVSRCEVAYRRPARLDDLVEVRSRLVGLRGAKLSAVQTVWRAGEELVRVTVDVAAVRGDGRPTRIPAPVHAALEPFVQQSFVQPLEQG